MAKTKTLPVASVDRPYVPPVGHTSISKLQARIAECESKLSDPAFAGAEREAVVELHAKSRATLDGLLKASAGYAAQELQGIAAAQQAEIDALKSLNATLQLAVKNRDEQIAALQELLAAPGVVPTPVTVSADAVLPPATPAVVNPAD